MENGSKCIAAATSPSAVRGLSVNLLMCVDGSTEITIRNKKTGEIRQIPIEALETYDDMNDWQVLTDYGWSDFEGLKITTSEHKLLVKTEANELRCSLSHRIMTPRGWVEARKLKPTDKCKTIHGLCSVISITLIEGHTKLYDLIGVEKGSRYYTNDIVSHNCDEFAHLGPNLADEFIASVFPTLSSSETSKLAIVSTPKGLNHYHKMWVEAESGTNGFIPIKASWQDHPLRTPEWAEEQRKKLGDVRYRQEVEVEFQGSSYTLVDGTKLANLSISQPIHETDQLEVFAAPEKDHSYVMTVDVSRGRHLDYSAFTVFDVTEMPYKVVATFKDNTISTLEYPHLVYNTARQYNNAFVLIEVNDLGEEVSNTIWYEYEYENLYFTDKDRLTEARGYPGVRTTKKVKSVGCSVLKELIEKDQLIVNSHKIIEELGVFVLKRTSYAADDTSINDDLCTTLWLFAWLTKQDIFQETTNNNLRKALADKKSAYIDSTMTPYGFYDNGINSSQANIAEDNKRLPDKSDPYFLTDDQIELLNW